MDKCYILCVDKRYVENGVNTLKWKARSKLPFDISRIKEVVCGKGEYNIEYDIIDPKEIPDYWTRGPFGNLVNSYCAFLCFQYIIKDAKKNNYERILILEDDFEFVDDFDIILNRAREQKPFEDWDMLYLGANHTWSPTKQLSPNILKLYGSLCWHAVALKNTVYDEILSWIPDEPIDKKAAEVLHPKYNCLAIWPSIIIQKAGFSNVEGKLRDYLEFFKSKGNPCL